MAVNLTKPFRGREYTPVHLMDEEESIQRSSLTAAPKLPSCTPEHIAHESAAPEQSADIDVSVAHNENFPAVVESPDLNACVNEPTEETENADNDTPKVLMSRGVDRCFFFGLAFVVLAIVLYFFPKIIEILAKMVGESNQSEVEAAVSHFMGLTMEAANTMRPYGMFVGILGMIAFSLGLIRTFILKK